MGTSASLRLSRLVRLIALVTGLGACVTSTESVVAPPSDGRETDDAVQQLNTTMSALCHGQPGITFIAEASGISARFGIDFIPIEEANGKRYELMFRDALPIENSDGFF